MNPPSSTSTDSPACSYLHYRPLSLPAPSSSSSSSSLPLSSVSPSHLYPAFGYGAKRDRDGSNEKRNVKKLKSEEIHQNLSEKIARSAEKQKLRSTLCRLLKEPQSQIAELDLTNRDLLQLYKLAKKEGAEFISLEIKNHCLAQLLGEKEPATKLSMFLDCAEAFKDDLRRQDVGNFFKIALLFSDGESLFSCSFLAEPAKILAFLDQNKGRNPLTQLTLKIKQDVVSQCKIIQKVFEWFPKLSSLTLTNEEGILTLPYFRRDPDFKIPGQDELFELLGKVKNLRTLKIDVNDAFCCLNMEMSTLVEKLSCHVSLEEVVLKNYYIEKHEDFDDLYEENVACGYSLINEMDFTKEVISELSSNCPKLVSISLVGKSGEIKIITIQRNAG